MKKLALVGVLALVVACCVIAAGCTSTQEQGPTTVDYSDMNNWMFYPTEQTHDVDVIYIYPTVSASDDLTYADRLDDPVMRAEAADVYKHQGSVFETVADVYVPYYREFSGQDIYAAMDGDMAPIGTEMPIAIDDVYDALDYYFTHANNGRPFILAGHSQGTIMLKSVLSEYMADHPEYYKNMVAAYMLGFPVTESDYAASPYLKAATGADDTGVVVSWNTEIAGNPNETGVFKKADAVLINPLNWKTDSTYAGKDENHGSFIRFENGTYGIGPGQVDAQILNHIIVVSEDSPVTAALTLSPNDVDMIVDLAGTYSRHMDDYDYFYQNIRENAALRTAAFIRNMSA
ncbi:MAG TPA: DUF3089 domain-containing protein [Methanocorpusculum sp.]|nr:DUF3089 domain-containing protein [Methanocorpusculum sp.]